MPLRLPPLSGLRLFEAAARCGSFKRAAHELNLTPGAFSHGIDALEQWLDVQLFERKPGGVVLTEAGRQYLPYISDALSMIATGTLRLPSRRFEERLSISSADLFASRLLLPRLHKFRDMHPNMLVTVDASRENIRLPSDQFDVAIRNSREPWPGLACDLLGRLVFIPVGAPGYIRNLLREGSLDWSRATLIHDAAVAEDWETWCNHTRIDISAARKLVVSTGRFALEAATDGLGLAIGRWPVIDDDLAAGRLAIAVDRAVPVRSGYWLLRPPGNETRREIIAFRDWLLEEMAQLKWNGLEAFVSSAMDQATVEQTPSTQPGLSE
jgi:LysR family transcriptional regulator, glycine cleavage system transcriptional activator